jgi:hypothetical protein
MNRLLSGPVPLLQKPLFKMILVAGLAWWAVPVGRAGDAAAIDPAVKKVVRATSKKYTTFGFKKYTLGTSREEVERLVELEKGHVCAGGFHELPPFGTENWLVNAKQREAFLFHDDRLVGFRKVYAGDNQGYFASLSELFGKTAPENVMVQNRNVKTYVNDKLSEIWEGSVSAAQYFFPKTIIAMAPVVFTFKDIRAQKLEKHQSIEICVMERAFCEKALDKDTRSKRTAMKWLREVARQVEKDRLDPAGWPKYPGSKEKDTVAERKQPKGFDQLALHKENAKASPYLVARIVTKAGSRDLPVDTCQLGLRFSAVPGSGSNSFHGSVLAALADRCYAVAAQEYWPPKGGQVRYAKLVTARTDVLGAWSRYQWETKDGWTVRATSDGLELTKKLKKSLD